MTLKNIRREHVKKAIKYIGSHGVPKKRKSRKYLLIHENKIYPPKYVLSLAHKFAVGREMEPEEFSGGKLQTNKLLKNLGFRIKELPKGERKDTASSVEKIERTPHNERCPKCKKTIKRLLERIYGKVEVNHKFNTGTFPEDFKNTPYYESLLKIYRALQNYRGFRDFVRIKSLPRCDFFVPNPGFIVEFDESQHFTFPRKIALENYPEDIKLGFDKKRWIGLCEKINARDNDPPYRDEQRAWYDTLRDFSFNILGLPTIRIYSKENVWCELDEKNKSDILWFKNFIQKNMASSIKRKQSLEKGGLRIGLAFPELGNRDKNVDHFLSLLKDSNISLDLLIFPESYESIEAEDAIEPEDITSCKGFKETCKKYTWISKELKLSIIVGISVDYKDTSISGGGNDQYCFFVTPKGNKALYHKHSSSKYTAFFDDQWSIGKNFPVLAVGNKKIGISICHDSYISLIPRVLKTKGTDIWVNISFQNVRSHIWEAVLQTRAIENEFISICTLHRNSKPSRGEGKPQKEPYAFSEDGKIKLRELKKNILIEKIPPEKRAGKIYYFNTDSYETYPIKEILKSNLAKKADTISINKDQYGNIKIKGRDANFVFKDISLKEFIFTPEKLWELSLKERDKIALFSVWAENEEEWKNYKSKVERIINGRVIEFSTLFVFLNKKTDDILMAAYRSSNYKDSRIFFPRGFPFKIDKRFLKGMESVYIIALDDREKDEAMYFKRISQIIHFL